MRRSLLVALFALFGIASTLAQMDMLPQIFRDLPPELESGLPSEMRFAEYRQLNRNVDFFTMFMSMFIPGYGLFHVEAPHLAWPVVGVRVVGYAMMGGAVALQWDYFYDLFRGAALEPVAFQRFLRNAFLFGGGILLNGIAWATDVTLAYHIAKNERDLVQYLYGIQTTVGQELLGSEDAAQGERYLRGLLVQAEDAAIEAELRRQLPFFAARYPRSPFAGEALYFHASILAGEGRDAMAFAYALRSLYRYPDGSRAPDAIRLASFLVEQNRAHWGLSLAAVTQLIAEAPASDLSEAERAFEVVSRLYGTQSQRLQDAVIHEARAFLESKYDRRFSPAILQMIADILTDQQQYREAASYLASLVIAYQDSSSWIDGALSLGRLYAGELDDRDRARIVLRAIVERYPDSQEAGKAAEILSNL